MMKLVFCTKHKCNRRHYETNIAIIKHTKILLLSYFSGLTGGSCSGKSNIARYLEDIGAGIIDCDKLGHLAYEPGTECYSKILENFGQDLKMENGKIDRKKLGGKVFSSPESLHKLESIVWPEILKLALEKTENLHQKGKKIIIWDAAVLLAAEWNKHVHEVNIYFNKKK